MSRDPNLPEPAAFRILDASINRTSEGLRTLEELARFALDDPALTEKLKSIRHALAAAVSRLPRNSLLLARDTEGDVGTQIGQQSEYQRSSLTSVLAAASSRTQQSLRVMEEASKTIDATISRELEQLRYRCYTVCSQLELAWMRRDRRECLAQAQLYVLIDAGPDESTYSRQVTALCEAGVDMLQLRDRGPDDRTLIERARRGTEIARRFGVLFIMNDRADLALAADTDGVHVGQEELPAATARQIVGPQRLVGVSTHDLAQARQAVADGADYIGCGPVFAGKTKKFSAYVGPALLQQVAAAIELPAFAIGGIDESNVDQVVQAGFRRVAVTGAIRDASDPQAAAKQLKQLLQ